MPVFQNHRINGHHMLGIWNIDESYDELEKMSASLAIDRTDMRTYKSELKQKQWLAARLLLHELLPDAGRIAYDKLGAPHIKSERALSISHSHQMVAVLLGGKDEVGVDIQYFSPKIERVREKFCSPGELLYSEGEGALEKLHLIWCAKEAIYKKLKNPGLIFSTDIAIPDLELSEKGNFTAVARNRGSRIDVDLQYEFLGDYTLVYTAIT